MSRRLAPAAAAAALSAAAIVAATTASRPSRLALAPPAAHALPNPFEGRPDAVEAGRKLFERHCASCHGDGGRGGRTAPAVAVDPVTGAPAGDLFWFVTNGDLRAGMPAWSRLPDARRWQLVTYLKSLRAAPAR